MEDTTTYRAYRCRLYPKPVQEAYFRRTFSCCRTVYNHFLEVRIAAYEARRDDPTVRVPSRFDMCRMLTSYKKTEVNKEGRPYLKDVDSTALVYELQHLDDAFRRFFQRMRKGARDAGYPRFKGRGDKDSFTIAFKRPDFVQENRVRFAKIGWVNASVWRMPEGVPVSCTVSVDAAGRWWASILCKDVPEQSIPEAEGTVVVDLSEKPAPDAEPTDEERRDESLAKRIRREERKLERRKGSPKGSKSARYKKQSKRLARLRAKEADRNRTRAGQAAAEAVRTAGKVVLVMPEEPDRADRELERQLKRKCREAGRELVEEKAAEQPQDKATA